MRKIKISKYREYVLRNLFEVHMYLNAYNMVKSSTVTAGMTWA